MRGFLLIPSLFVEQEMAFVRILFAAISVLALAALWFAFRPHAAIPAAPQPKEFHLVLKAGKLASGAAEFQVRQGDEVRLRIEADRNEELHLHGYDLKLRVKGGEPATLAFAAQRSGRFELELHRGHTQLGALEVYPK